MRLDELQLRTSPRSWQCSLSCTRKPCCFFSRFLCSKLFFPVSQDVRNLPTKFQTNSNNLKFGPWNFSAWKSGSHMAGCSPSESDRVCWCSLIFLSSRANFSPNHETHISLPSLSPAWVHSEAGGALPEWQGALLLFPFSPLSTHIPSVLHLKFRARWELTAYKLEASVMQPAPLHSGCQGLQQRPKLNCVFIILNRKARLGSACWRNRTASLWQRDCADSITAKLLKLLEEPHSGWELISAQPLPRSAMSAETSTKVPYFWEDTPTKMKSQTRFSWPDCSLATIKLGFTPYWPITFLTNTKGQTSFITHTQLPDSWEIRYHIPKCDKPWTLTCLLQAANRDGSDSIRPTFHFMKSTVTKGGVVRKWWKQLCSLYCHPKTLRSHSTQVPFLKRPWPLPHQLKEDVPQGPHCFSAVPGRMAHKQLTALSNFLLLHIP